MELPPDVAGPVNKSRLIANTEQAQLWIGLEGRWERGR